MILAATSSVMTSNRLSCDAHDQRGGEISTAQESNYAPIAREQQRDGRVGRAARRHVDRLGDIRRCHQVRLIDDDDA